MKYSNYYILTFFILASSFFYSQDIHWSQFNQNPLFQNPANTGLFDGDYRLHANFRNQWKSVTRPFTTTSLSGDLNLEKFHKIGVGVLFFNDFAGDGKMTTNELNLLCAFPIKIDSNLTIRTGINFGINNRNFNSNPLSFDSQYNGMFYDPNLPTNESFQTTSKTNITLGLGANAQQKFSKFKLQYGIAFFNLNRPNQGFFGASIKRPIRTSVNTTLSYPISATLTLEPAINIQIQKKYTELIFGSSIKQHLKLTSSQEIDISFGTWWRTNDALILNIGCYYNNLFGGFSYDINFSTLKTASNFRGGPELAFRYIFKKFKPENKLRKICPDYL